MVINPRSKSITLLLYLCCNSIDDTCASKAWKYFVKGKIVIINF